MNYRKLTNTEIDTLVQQGCTADDWAQVEVAPGFVCTPVRRVKFSGHNRLGVFTEIVLLHGRVPAPSGLYDAWLHNCTVGNHVLIRRIGRYIAHYDIADRAVICDTGLLETTGESTFGNGVQANVIDETGEHALPLYNELSAQVAYLWAMYRPQLAAHTAKWIVGYCAALKSRTGKIAAGAHLCGCGSITDVAVGEQAQLENVLHLHNGSINSTAEAPVYIGHGCSCEHFIIQSGASLRNGVQLSHCLIGQGGRFDRQFSAGHSVFFANSQGAHGEACSVFAGPYTVTHHKSTLLIAALCSFMNAGSGSNQSNHAYKTGPIHYGITARGLKLASNSYLFFPAAIGACTLVSGRHYSHPDTVDFPFSYLIEKDGKSHLLPGINFAACGTWRDAEKWPQRDLRRGKQLDHIHFDLLNPCTVGSLQRGKAWLAEARTVFGRVTVEAAARQRGIHHYEWIETFYLLGELHKRQAANLPLTAEDTPAAEWIDAAGMYCPRAVFEQLIDGAAAGKLPTLHHLAAAIAAIDRDVPRYAWNWTAQAFAQKFGKRPDRLSADERQQYAAQFKEMDTQLRRHIARDAEKDKEFYTE